MPGTQKNHRFLFSPYIFSLGILLVTVTIAVSTWLLIAAPVAGDRGVFIAFVLGIALLILVPLGCSRECFGWYTVDRNSISFHAPFRHPLTLRYEDIRYVGAGRNFLSVNYAYWLYLSMDPVPREEFEDMRRFKLTNRSLRIAYSKKAFVALHECLPPDLARQLEHSKTTLRAWGVRDI